MAITHAEFVTMLQNAADIPKEALINFGRESSENVITLTETAKEAAVGDLAEFIAQAAADFRNRFSSIVSKSRMRGLFDPVFQSALNDLIDDDGRPDKLYRYFDTNNYSVKAEE